MVLKIVGLEKILLVLVLNKV